MAIKKCPHCGSNTFLARVIRAARVEAQDDNTFKILQETPKYDVEIVKCPSCNNKITETDLLEVTPCKSCGTLTESKNLDTEGVCDVCKALTVRPDLVNASKEDIIRMLLHLEASSKKNATTLSKASNANVLSEDNDIATFQSADDLPIIKDSESLPEVTISVGDTIVPEEIKSEINLTAADKMEAARKAMENASSESIEKQEEVILVEEKKTTRKRRPKKASTTEPENTVEQPEELKEEPEQTSSAPENFIQPSPEEAPFPEQDQVMQQMFTEQSVVPPLPQGGFPLFDNEESF